MCVERIHSTGKLRNCETAKLGKNKCMRLKHNSIYNQVTKNNEISAVGCSTAKANLTRSVYVIIYRQLNFILVVFFFVVCFPSSWSHSLQNSLPSIEKFSSILLATTYFQAPKLTLCIQKSTFTKSLKWSFVIANRHPNNGTFRDCYLIVHTYTHWCGYEKLQPSMLDHKLTNACPHMPHNWWQINITHKCIKWTIN